MGITLEEHRRLLKREFLLQQQSFDKVLNASARRLREQGEIYVAQYSGFDENRGNIVLRFSATKPFPRKNEHLTLFVPGAEFLHPNDWDQVNYKTIRSNPQRLAEVVPVWFNFDPGNRLSVGFKGATLDFIKELPNGVPLILGPNEPPLEYLLNLIHLLSNADLYSKFYETVTVEANAEYWQPVPLKNDENASLNLSAEFTFRNDCIIQGPPGTGKSYLIANLCANYLSQGKKVLVTALTNRALIELAEKDGLREFLQKGKVYKTSLSTDEKKKLSKLSDAGEYTDEPGSLLLATYFKMSERAKQSTGSQFDLVVVEEASQAFLATIGAARHLGENTVVIGDQMQLEPIRLIKTNDLEKPELEKAFNGLDTYGRHFRNTSKYILNETFRLNQETTRHTNAFYNDLLTSTQPPLAPLQYSDSFKKEVDVNRAVVIKRTNMSIGDKIPSNEIAGIKSLVLTFQKSNPQKDVTVLSFFVETVKELQRSIYPEVNYSERVTIETVDRIQGLTTDICIFLIPNAGLGFSLNPNRFNVATSRAKYHTIIFAPSSLVLDSFDQRVAKYFARCNHNGLA